MNRETLKLGWQHQAEPCEEYAEIPAEIYRAAITKPPPIVVKPIRKRLENWAISEGRQDLSGRGGDCMTGVVCERMRRASLGDVWSGANAPVYADETDAKKVSDAWRRMPSQRYKLILMWHYIHRARPEFICKRFGIYPRPASVYQIELARAEGAIEYSLSLRP